MKKHVYNTVRDLLKTWESEGLMGLRFLNVSIGGEELIKESFEWDGKPTEEAEEWMSNYACFVAEPECENLDDVPWWIEGGGVDDSAIVDAVTDAVLAALDFEPSIKIKSNTFCWEFEVERVQCK